MKHQPRHHHLNLLLASTAAALALLAFLESAGAATCHPDDEAGLLGFKKGITADPSGMLATWQAGTDCCAWDSIICLDDGRVISIGLYGDPDTPRIFLSGKISRSISRLTQLIGIHLVNHPNLTGPFPTTLSAVSRHRQHWLIGSFARKHRRLCRPNPRSRPLREPLHRTDPEVDIKAHHAERAQARR